MLLCVLWLLRLQLHILHANLLICIEKPLCVNIKMNIILTHRYEKCDNPGDKETNRIMPVS
jgi:hypothetical protein